MFNAPRHLAKDKHAYSTTQLGFAFQAKVLIPLQTRFCSFHKRKSKSESEQQNNKTLNMTTTKKNVAEVKTVAAANESINESINAIVTKVMLPEGSDNRITLVLDKEIETIDFLTGESKQSKTFGLNIYHLVNMVKQEVEYISLADALAMGSMVNPQIIALSLTDAEITFVRVHHEAGDKRYEGEYSKECFTTEIKGVKTHIKPIFQKTLDTLVMTSPCVIKQVNINPYNI